MKKASLLVLAIFVAAAVVTYACDYLFWRYRFAMGHNGYGTLTVQNYYAIQEKNGRTEYDYLPPQVKTCVNALFPRSGFNPCWYERKHTEKPIRI